MDIREQRKIKLSEQQLLQGEKVDVSAINDSLIFNLLRKIDLQYQILQKYNAQHQKMTQMGVPKLVHSPYIILLAFLSFIPPMSKRKISLAYLFAQGVFLYTVNEFDKKRVAMKSFPDLALEYTEAYNNYLMLVRVKAKMHSFLRNNGLGLGEVSEESKRTYGRYRMV